MPAAASDSIAAPFSRATASTLAMNSWCSRCALLTSATVGGAMPRELGDLARWFMPSSSTPARCQCVVLAQPQHRQRHADVVVQVAGGGERRRRRPGAQDARSSASPWSCRCCRSPRPAAAASGGATPRPARCSAAACRPPAGPAGPASARPRFGECRHRAGGARLREEVVRIEALAPQRDEQVARLQRAGVAVHARDPHVGRRRPASSRAPAHAPAPASSCVMTAPPRMRRAQCPRASIAVGERLLARRRFPGSPRGPCRR